RGSRRAFLGTSISGATRPASIARPCAGARSRASRRPPKSRPSAPGSTACSSSSRRARGDSRRTTTGTESTMGARRIGGPIVRLGAGVAVGIAFGVAFGRLFMPRDRAPVTEHARGERVLAAESSSAARSTVAPERADASPREPAAMEAKRDAARIATSDEIAELARLHEQVAELEEEIARLRAELATGNPRRHSLHEMFAANDLEHGPLYEEIVDLIVNDPESVTDDPRHAFALALRLIDETGLAAKSKVEDRREVAPEPRAPELRLTL